MDRRLFMGLMAGMAAVPAVARAATADATADEEKAIRDRIADLYEAFSAGDAARYRSFMADDYLLLENGEVIDLDGDIAFFADRPEGFHRTDSFDFRHVSVKDDMAYAVYFLNSLASDARTPPRKLHWLESTTFRRINGEWRCALIHSTVIAPGETVEAGKA